MIKFELNKAYKRLDSDKEIPELVVNNGDNLIKTLSFLGYDFGTRHSTVWRTSFIDGVEKVIAGDTTILSANMPFCSETEEDEIKANIEEVKEEDKEEKKKEELQKDSDDWIIGKEYEAICIETKQRYKLKLVWNDETDCYPLRFESVVSSFNYSDLFEDLNDIAFTSGADETVVVFKHGIKSISDWEEAKEERKPVCFEVGKEYRDANGDIGKSIAIFDTNEGRAVIFYNKDIDAIIKATIKTLNSVEYTSCSAFSQKVNFIADEKYRDEIKALL